MLRGMSDLASVRTRPYPEAHPSRRRDDVVGSVSDFVALTEEFEELVIASEAVFREDRSAHLADLQARLRRLPRCEP